MVLTSLGRPKQAGQGIRAGLRDLRGQTASDMLDKTFFMVDVLGLGYSGMYWIHEALYGVQRMMRLRGDCVVEQYKV